MRDPRSETTARPAARALPIDGVLFDLDGTLADTAPDLARALNRLRLDQGLDALPLERLRDHASHGARGLLGAGLDLHPGDASYAVLRDAFLDHYAAALCVDTTLFDGVPALLDAIEARGLRWGIVTNKAARFTTPLAALLRLSTRAGAIIAGDSTPHTKPHPAPLLAGAQGLGVAPSRCLYVGDAERDVAAGVAAGMATIIARYGYIEARETPEAWPADGSIDAPLELLAWLPDR